MLPPSGLLCLWKTGLLFHLSRSVNVFGRDVPSWIPLPPYIRNQTVPIPTFPLSHSTESISQLRQAGSIVRSLFEELESFLRPGLSTQDLDDFIFHSCLSKKVYPSPLGYLGFPKSVCTSVNEVACHGIPSSKCLLNQGDLLSIDISIFTGSVHGDACRSYVLKCDSVPAQTGTDATCIASAEFLCTVAKTCRDAGVAICAPGVPFADIARVISDVANNNYCRVVAGIRGHGIGTFLHGPPNILHSVYETAATPSDSTADIMQPGHVFTIEPCIALADPQLPKTDSHDFYLRPALPLTLDDSWTVVTTDRVLTAQFEHTVLITDTGHSVLT